MFFLYNFVIFYFCNFFHIFWSLNYKKIRQRYLKTLKLWDGLDDLVQENIQTMEICATPHSSPRKKVKEDKAYVNMIYTCLNCKTRGKLVNLPIHTNFHDSDDTISMEIGKEFFRMKKILLYQVWFPACFAKRSWGFHPWYGLNTPKIIFRFLIYCIKCGYILIINKI